MSLSQWECCCVWQGERCRCHRRSSACGPLCSCMLLVVLPLWRGRRRLQHTSLRYFVVATNIKKFLTSSTCAPITWSHTIISSPFYHTCGGETRCKAHCLKALWSCWTKSWRFSWVVFLTHLLSFISLTYSLTSVINNYKFWCLKNKSETDMQYFLRMMKSLKIFRAICARAGCSYEMQFSVFLKVLTVKKYMKWHPGSGKVSFGWCKHCILIKQPGHTYWVWFNISICTGKNRCSGTLKYRRQTYIN